MENIMLLKLLKNLKVFILIVLFAVSLTACAKVGRDFPVEMVSSIEIGKTTQTEILNTFGPPWRKGLENGKLTWTYGVYRYTVSGTQTTDLFIKFNNEGIVESYNFSSN
jgi:hypothetical protein